MEEVPQRAEPGTEKVELFVVVDLKPSDQVDGYDNLVWEPQVREVLLSMLRNNRPRPTAIADLLRILGAHMNLELSDDENVRFMVERLGMSELRARFIVDIERGRIDGDTEVVDGSLTEADKRRLGIASIFDAPSGDNCGGGGGRAMPSRSMARAGEGVVSGSAKAAGQRGRVSDAQRRLWLRAWRALLMKGMWSRT
jgi:hypothetical protein